MLEVEKDNCQGTTEVNYRSQKLTSLDGETTVYYEGVLRRVGKKGDQSGHDGYCYPLKGRQTPITTLLVEKSALQRISFPATKRSYFVSNPASFSPNNRYLIVEYAVGYDGGNGEFRYAVIDTQEKYKILDISPCYDSSAFEYKGFIFIGLIIVKGEPMVIEYNVRMGDPETEVVMPRIQSDLVALFQAVAEQKLDEVTLTIDPRSATTIMVVSGGYPEEYDKGFAISGIENISDSIVFHAGTKLENGQVVTNGGRVLAVTSFGTTYQEAIKKSYQNINKLHFDKMYFRKDIGFDLA